MAPEGGGGFVVSGAPCGDLRETFTRVYDQGMTSTRPTEGATMSTVTTPTETPVFVACGRCAGRGRLPEFAGLYEGICFECNGARGHWSTVEREARLAARRVTDRARRVRKAEAERVANEAAFTAAFGEEAALSLLALVEREDSFGYAVRLKVWKYGADVRQGTVDAVIRAAQAIAEREAAPEAPVVEVPEGRVEVTGRVVSTKVVDGFAYGSSVLKMLVEDDRGFRVFGTMPLALSVDRDDRVTFTATLERSRDDAGFGFFKRPTKAAQV